MKKEIRQKVFDKCNGNCAYCGDDLPAKGWHVDHVIAQYRHPGKNERLFIDGDVIIVQHGVDDIENLLPACRRCNLWKKTFSLEMFRAEIAAQADRLSTYSAQFRLAHAFGVVAKTREPVQFYFEKL